jgi:hypothetical protein
MYANATVKIGIHLNIHGIRRCLSAQVIDWVPRELQRTVRLPIRLARRAMLRSESRALILYDLDAPKLNNCLPCFIFLSFRRKDGKISISDLPVTARRSRFQAGKGLNP